MESSPVVVSINVTEMLWWWVDSSSVLVVRNDSTTGKEEAVVWNVLSNSLVKVSRGSSGGSKGRNHE